MEVSRVGRRRETPYRKTNFVQVEYVGCITRFSLHKSCFLRYEVLKKLDFVVPGRPALKVLKATTRTKHAASKPLSTSALRE